MTNPHPAALTPEQIARTVWADILARISECPVGWPESGQPLADIIATAIRSAVMAERGRCIGIIGGWPADENCVPANAYELMDRDLAMIAAIRSTETDHDR